MLGGGGGISLGLMHLGTYALLGLSLSALVVLP